MDGTMDFFSGVVYQVNLSAFANVGNLTDPAVDSVSGSAWASVDPAFVIDPVFLSENPGFTLDFSSNLNSQPPANPVPESTNWGIAVAVLAFVVACARLRKGFVQWDTTHEELG